MLKPESFIAQRPCTVAAPLRPRPDLHQTWMVEEYAIVPYPYIYNIYIRLVNATVWR